MRGGLLFFCLVASCVGQVYRIESVAGSGQAGYAGDGGFAVRGSLNAPSSVALGPAGRLYIADVGNNRVRRIELNGTLSTVAGNGERGHSGDLAPAVQAQITVSDVAVDPQGTLFIGGGSAIRAVNAEGVIWTIAGPEVGISDVTNIALEPDGTLVVTDGGRLRRVTREAAVTDIPHNVPGSVTDVSVSADGVMYFVAGETIQRMDKSGSTTQVAVEFPVNEFTRLAVDRLGEVYVSSGKVWKLSGGRGWILAGTDSAGYSGDNGPGVLAQVNQPGGLAIDAGFNVFFADTLNNRIRSIRSPLAGAISAVFPSPRAAEIWPRNVVLRWTPVFNAESYEVWFGTDPAALTLVATTSNNFHALPALENRTSYYWRITTRLIPHAPVNSGISSFSTTTASDVSVPEAPTVPQPHNFAVGLPTSILLTWSGGGASRYEVYLDTNEYLTQRIGAVQEQRFFVSNLRPNTKYYWKVLAFNDRGQETSRRWEFTTGPAAGYPYLIDTFAGTPLPLADGIPAAEAALQFPKYVVAGSQGAVTFVDGNRRVRRIGADGIIRTLFASQTGDIVALAADSSGNVYAALSEYVLRIPGTGPVTVFAGQPGRRGYSGDNGPATLATMNGIAGLAVDGRGYLYISDLSNNRVRVVSNGQIRTHAGTGECVEMEIAGSATSVSFCGPGRMTTDANNNLYVAASGRVIRVSVDGTASTAAGVVAVSGIAVDGNGSLLMLDAETMLVRRAGAEGPLETLAGEPDTDGRAFGFFGDGLPATRGRFAFPDGIAADSAGNLFMADTGNHRIRKIDASGFLSTIAGVDTTRGDRGPSTGAWLSRPTDVAVDASGNVFVADSGNHRIRRVTQTRYLDTVAGGGPGSVQEVQQSAGRVGRNARDVRIDLTADGLVETDDKGNVVFTDDRFFWMHPDGTQAVYTMNVGGEIINYVNSYAPVPGGIARGSLGETYVSDTLRHQILRIDATGTATVVAGTGGAGFAGEGGPAAIAQVNAPRALSISPSGELFVAEFGRIRKITTDGRILNVLNEHANGIAHDRLGTLYLTAGRSIFALSEGGQLRRIAGRESAPAGPNEGGLAMDTRLTDPRGIVVNRDGDIYFADAGDSVVRRLVVNVPSSMVVQGGDGQTIVAGQPTTPLSVRITGRTGAPVPGVQVVFYITSDPGGPVAVATVTTNAAGIASISPSAGSRTGPVTFAAVATGLQPVGFSVTVQAGPR